MATYNIPGITTTVIDYSTIQPQILGGRSVLIAGPSKFGDDEEIMEFSDANEANYKTGGPNITKYGLSVYYVLGALSVTGKVYFKRITASDATYANKIIDKDFNIQSLAKTVDKNAINNSDNNLSIYAKGKGEGYNEFYLKFEAAPDVEKIYADDEGDPDYKYNFLKVLIFQKTSNGIKTIMPATVISLIDTDPRQNNMPILDITTGETLYINDRIDTKNDFISVYLNENYLNDLKQYLNIKDLIEDKGTPELILKDTVTGINYKVKADAQNNLYIEATQQEGQDKIILKYYTNNANNYKKIYVEKGQLLVDTDLTVNDGYEKLYAVGDLNYVEIYIDAATQELKVVNFDTPRSNLYKLLLNNIWNLENGFDGANFSINGVFNFNGPGVTGSENVKMKLIEFFNTDTSIREVMYPEYDFDYIIDWSADLDVMNSIINLTDDVGNTMGILSLPLANNSDQDYTIRTEKLYQSTFNNVLYAGEWNLNHYNEYLGRITEMPQSYYQMIINLKVDNEISITEPPAGPVKAQLPVSNIKLSYAPRSADIEKLRNVQINTIIKETYGIYTIDQLTMYKKASKLSRMNVVKVIHRMRKDLPKLLKPFIQIKETSNNSTSIENIVSTYMNKWKVTADGTNPDEIFEKIDINTIFIKEEYKLVVTIRVTPIGTIEKIEIPIIVE